jgi:predicted RNase H-like HicB family nuclease
MRLAYPACFYKEDEGEGYAVVVPDLPGCVSGGDSLAEAILMGIDAASGWIITELEDGLPAPPASPIGSIKLDEEIGSIGFVSVLALDLDEYAKKYGKNNVTKNLELEMPAYLNTFAESQRINYSQVLQESLAEKYWQHVHGG